MGGVAVLQPEDLFNHQNHRHHFISPAMKSQSRSSIRRKRSPQKNTTSPLKEYNNHRSSPSSSKPTSINPVKVGPIKILKRGEALTITATPTPSSSLDLTLKEQQRPVQKAAATSKKKKKTGAGVSHDSVLLGPPENDLNQAHLLISSDCYAGSAFISSPPPSSLPVPAFFKKKNLVLADGNNTTNCTSNSNNGGDATTDLLRLLRLDLS